MAEGEGGEFGASAKVILVHVRNPPMYDDMDINEDFDVVMSGSEGAGSDVEMGSDVEAEVSVTANLHGHGSFISLKRRKLARAS